MVARFLDVDHLISACIQIPKQETVKLAENRITYVIQLKHVLELLEPLRAALGEGMNPLLKACREVSVCSYPTCLSHTLKVCVCCAAHLNSLYISVVLYIVSGTVNEV